MNSIEIAQKLIDENEKDIEDFRRRETKIRGQIMKYKYDISTHEQSIKNLQASITMAEEDLKRNRKLMTEYLVDSMALAAYIDAGCGMDMLD